MSAARNDRSDRTTTSLHILFRNDRIAKGGSVPVHFKVADGNTEDSTTHVETWAALRQLVGSADFLYVADSKLCTRGNLKHIDGQGGRTVLPRTWKEDTLFKDWIQSNTPQWDEVARKPHPRLKNGPPDELATKLMAWKHPGFSYVQRDVMRS